MPNEVKTIFVTKKQTFDHESKTTLHDLREQLGMNALTDVKVINRYDFLDLPQAVLEEAVPLILSEVQVDDVFNQFPEIKENQRVFGVRYLPAQYDQRSDSALACIKLLMNNCHAIAVSSKVFLLSGDLTDEMFEKIKNYVINPVDSCEISLTETPTFSVELPEAGLPETIDGFCQESVKALEVRRQTMGLAMTLDDLQFCQTYFRDTEHRDPTETEIRVIDTYWSDHCRHTTFGTSFEELAIEEGPLAREVGAIWQEYLKAREEYYGEKLSERPVTLMDMATLGAKVLKSYGFLSDVDESEEINACGIHITVDVDGMDELWLLLFKNETHNHPTEIEPFGGAATCIGGAIRDPLSGRGYVFGAMRVTGSANPLESVSETLKGKLPQRKITTGALSGFSSYGNQIGLATGKVKEFYHPGFKAKRMECGAVLGAVPMNQVRREEPTPGDLVVLLGGRTGKDGIGGATGSSKDHTVDSLATGGSEVQKGNPVTERKIQRFMRNPEVTKRIKRCNDFGAGGVAVAIGELCPGLDINLDKVPLKYKNLNATEITISESQERMVMVVEKSDLDRFLELAAEENLEATYVADVTDTNRLRIYFKGAAAVDISRAFLDTNGAPQSTKVRILAPTGPTYFDQVRNFAARDLKSTFEGAVTTLNTAMNRGMVEQFDGSIGACTVIAPLGGKNRRTENDALVMKIPLIQGETDTAAFMAYGYNPFLSEYSPFLGSQYAVLESLARLVSTGGQWRKARLSFQEYFEKLRDEPARWGKPTAALLGSLKAQWAMQVGSIGGKDSMSGSFEELDVPPTLVSFAVAPGSASKAVGQEILSERGGSLFYIPLRPNKEGMPDYEKAAAIFDAVEAGLRSGEIVAAQTISMGGAAKAIANMCYGNGAGVTFTGETDAYDAQLGTFLLREEWIGSFVVQVINPAFLGRVEEIVKMGDVTGDGVIRHDNESFIISELLEKEEAVFEPIFPKKAEVPANFAKPIEDSLYTASENRFHAGSAIGSPKALILTFPGTNCEYDMQKQLKQAGATPDIFVFKNIHPGDVEKSIESISKKIRESQMLILPGGFSLGDEPDGSAKFITAVLRNASVAEAINDLIHVRDGLVLGICNGFQALIKVGLVPFGEIIPPEEHNPTLTFNTIGRHVAGYVNTKVVSKKSPWLQNATLGGVYTVPVSHGEGRLVVSPESYQSLLANGQISSLYTTPDGQPSYEIDVNPNGSSYAIEGLLSPDGHVFGKMAHSERIGNQIGKNIPGEKDMQLFRSGVEYFI